MPQSRPRGTVRYDNSGRVVLISGGSSGIGRAVAESFLASGARVVVLDIKTADDFSTGIDFLQGDTSQEGEGRGVRGEG